jgi:polyisoprenoid-binding protein YceI
VTWRSVEGQISVNTDRLTTGETLRDNFAKNAVFESAQHREVTFKVDSLVGMTRKADTVRGTGYGEFSFHGVTRPMTAAVKVFHEAGGVRVLAKFEIPAEALTEQFDVSKYALGLGVGTHIWKTLFMGVDAILRPEPSNTSRGSN